MDDQEDKIGVLPDTNGQLQAEIGGLRDRVRRLEGDNKEIRATNKKLQATVGRLEGENEELQATVGRVEGELQATVERLKTERKDYDKINEKVASLEVKLNAQARLHSEGLKVLDDKIKKQAKTIESLMIPARDICLRGMLKRCREKLMATLPERRTAEPRTAWLQRATTDPFVLWVFDQCQAVSKRIHKNCPGEEEAKEVLKSLNQDKDKDKYKQLFDHLYPGCRK
ncbi:hypothetical protein PHYSODRAFT_337449 [Phytophthora sojae]|uniref:Uncharacterized protein n=1 Tax=Phytophthora sojae (strain P6497) TaxID=1094619 RepID=G5A167_PHYSP|nr:hypothetical protein PHYSODRAFT_337449 [Phytophthora sojae]EGZ10668.1 hypothetical protein PHYSODRAFT_337449 [Phytophthora sojae]|eukprot:XP_009533413.1 hypothetical protein PHYSODRAFT_337449 [Phytophthora sojae]